MNARSMWLLVVSILAPIFIWTSPRSVGEDQKPAGAALAPSVPLPRPVDPVRRAALGFPDPRAATPVLAEIDALSAAMHPIIEQNDVWKQRFRDYLRMQAQRVDLVSELEEGRYEGERLTEMLEMKLSDIGDAGQNWPESTFAQLRDEMAERHAKSAIGVRAKADDMLEKVHNVLHYGFRIHPDDYGRLAAVESSRKDDELAGITLLEALHFEPENSELQTKWQDWMVKNLGKDSIGFRTVMRRRTFDKPIRLQGEGLDHERLDTRDWAGDVVLVDFWGTWCVPCMKAMPFVKAARDKHAAEGLRVVGVLCDFEFDKARGFLKSRGFDWPQFTLHTATADAYMHPIATRYAVGGFPTLWIIDRKGILREETDAESLEESLARYLAEPRPPK